jgi:hypothetical protein
MRRQRLAAILAMTALALLVGACGRSTQSPAPSPPDPRLASMGTIEVTARLVEIPEGAIFKRDLYDYATVLKYEVLKVHRGDVKEPVIYVGHYNPWKPRRQAPDRRVPEVGGNLQQFQPHQTHHLALQAPIEDFFMGGIVNKYFGQITNTIYWAVWTNLE